MQFTPELLQTPHLKILTLLLFPNPNVYIPKFPKPSEALALKYPLHQIWNSH